jgi:hypothetical protein
MTALKAVQAATPSCPIFSNISLALPHAFGGFPSQRLVKNITRGEGGEKGKGGRKKERRACEGKEKGENED